MASGASSLLELTRALRAFDAKAFAERHGGHKESSSKQSHEYLLRCPLCGGGNLRWNPTKAAGMGGWVCWNCRTSGNTLYLVQVLERIRADAAVLYVLGSYTGGDAQLDLRDIARMPEPGEVLSAKPAQHPAIEWPAGVIDARLHPRVRAYLHGRGIDDARIAEWDIRAGTAGRLTDYAVFPCYMDGRLVYYQGRASWNAPSHLSREERRAWEKATKYRKTLNPPNPKEGEAPRATAEDVLFNYDRARSYWHIVIVEGPVDAVQVGPHAVGLFGKGTNAKIERLRRMGARRYTVYLDRGEEERARALEIAAQLHGWAEVLLATPPEGYDAGALTREQNAYVVSRGVPAREAGGLVSALRP